MLYLLACELHFVLVLRMAKQTHTSQTEPKDRAIALQECDVFWTDKQKEKIKSGCYSYYLFNSFCAIQMYVILMYLMANPLWLPF